MKQLKPTFGLSFGLPYQGGGGYPFSPHGIYPHHGTVDGTGINLGLVSVNPLVSVQFTKDDYGNKVIKPFVNLHLTPNSYLINKFEDLVAYKKGVIFNKHKHYHVHAEHPHHPHHGGYEGPYREYPGEFHHGEPEIIHGPPPGYHHGPEIYDGPPSHFSGPDHYSGPPHHHYNHGPPEPYPFDHHGPPGHYEGPSGPGPDYFPGKPGYYDDPLNYGGGHYDSFSGRAFSNSTTTSPGASLFDQYQQKYNEGAHTYGNKISFDEANHNSIEIEQSNGFRGGKSLNFGGDGGKISFPSSRRRRDVTDKDQTINDISEGRSKSEKVNK